MVTQVERPTVAHSKNILIPKKNGVIVEFFGVSMFELKTKLPAKKYPQSPLKNAAFSISFLFQSERTK